MKRIFVLWLMLVLMLSGCGLFDTETLYCLPEAPEDYYDLQEALSAVIAQGLSYHAPAAGMHRETVQLVDLDGDGTDEAVAFFRSEAEGAVKCYIFSRQNGVYETAAILDCAGSSVASVMYEDLDGSGKLEILIACQVSQAVPQALQVFGYDGGVIQNLGTISCSRYALGTLGQEGAYLLCFSDQGSERGLLSCYQLRQGNLASRGEFSLSGCYSDMADIQEVVLEQGAEGIAVAFPQGETTVYDLITLTEEQLVQVKSDRLYAQVAVPQDIDGDGVTEFPQKVTEAGAEGETLLQWYGISPRGRAVKKQVTYQPPEGTWYLELPDSWGQNVSVSLPQTGEDNVACVTFSRKTGGEELLSIYTLTNTYALESGLRVLYSSAQVVYAASINENAELWEGTVTMAQVSEGFHPLEP